MRFNLELLDARFDTYPDLREHLTLSNLIKFIKCAALCRQDILLTQAGSHTVDGPPDFLSRSIKRFLSGTCELSEEDVDKCWEVLKDIIWDSEVPSELDAHPLEDFKRYGHDMGLSEFSCYLKNTASC